VAITLLYRFSWCGWRELLVKNDTLVLALYRTGSGPRTTLQRLW